MSYVFANAGNADGDELTVFCLIICLMRGDTRDFCFFGWQNYIVRFKTPAQPYFRQMQKKGSLSYHPSLLRFDLLFSLLCLLGDNLIFDGRRQEVRGFAINLCSCEISRSRNGGSCAVRKISHVKEMHFFLFSHSPAPGETSTRRNFPL